MKIYPFLTKVEKYNFEEILSMPKYENISKHDLLKKESESDHYFFIYFLSAIAAT